jgi:hypothetical protein
VVEVVEFREPEAPHCKGVRLVLDAANCDSHALTLAEGLLLRKRVSST